MKTGKQYRDMKSRAARGLVALFAVFALWAPTLLANPIAPSYDPATGNVTWGYPATGLDPNMNPIRTNLPPGGSLTFYWTDGDDIDPITGSRVHLTHPAPGYAPLNLVDDTDRQAGGPVTFHAPVGANPPITDYHLELTGAGFKHGSVTVGALQKDGTWQFVPLNTLSQSGYLIPDLEGDIPIYAAVNISLYQQDNPFGPLNGNYAVGAALDSLGLKIVDGMIPGVSGLYFATSPFGVDPTSATGFVPLDGDGSLLNSARYQALHGSIDILGTINTSPTPEPGSLWLLTIGAVLIAVGSRRSVRKSLVLNRR